MRYSFDFCKDFPIKVETFSQPISSRLLIPQKLLGDCFLLNETQFSEKKVGCLIDPCQYFSNSIFNSKNQICYHWIWFCFEWNIRIFWFWLDHRRKIHRKFLKKPRRQKCIRLDWERNFWYTQIEMRTDCDPWNKNDFRRLSSGIWNLVSFTFESFLQLFETILKPTKKPNRPHFHSIETAPDLRTDVANFDCADKSLKSKVNK